jgi:hypothetical protein
VRVAFGKFVQVTTPTFSCRHSVSLGTFVFHAVVAHPTSCYRIRRCFQCAPRHSVIYGFHGGEYEDYSLLGLIALIVEAVRTSERWSTSKRLHRAIRGLIKNIPDRTYCRKTKASTSYSKLSPSKYDPPDCMQRFQLSFHFSMPVWQACLGMACNCRVVFSCISATS